MRTAAVCPANAQEDAPKGALFRRRVWELSLGVPADRLDEDGRGLVRIAVGVGPAVLDVALLVHLDLPRDAHRRAAVGHAVAVLGPGSGLVEAGEALLDAGAVHVDVLLTALADRLAGGDDGVVALAHLLGGEVRV